MRQINAENWELSLKTKADEVGDDQIKSKIQWAIKNRNINLSRETLNISFGAYKSFLPEKLTLFLLCLFSSVVSVLANVEMSKCKRVCVFLSRNRQFLQDDAARLIYISTGKQTQNVRIGCSKPFHEIETKAHQTSKIIKVVNYALQRNFQTLRRVIVSSTKRCTIHRRLAKTRRY